ncbi:YceI family protein [Streptomyces sp. NPDC001070]
MFRNPAETTVPGTGPHEALTGAYIIDPVHSALGFSVRHAMITNVRGRFAAFEGLLKLDGRRPARSEAHMSVQTGSLNTGVRERDTHLTGPDFFDSVTFPLMVFRSTAVVPDGEGRFRMSGNLRIKDIELPLRIDLVSGGSSRDVHGQRRVGFEGTATLHRSDWGLDWNAPLASGGLLISDKVKLTLDISAVRLGPEAAA